jgi:hypothetical protein
MDTFRARVASAETGGRINIMIDDNRKIGVCEVAHTGGWQNWETVSCDLEPNITGSHNVFLMVTGSDDNRYLLNINWIEFYKK